MSLKIYGDPRAPGCKVVYFFLDENSIEYENVHVELMEAAHLAPDYLAINPSGLVPFLVEGDVRIQESPAIVQYLAASRGLEDRWYPTEPIIRSKIDKFLNWYHLKLRDHAAILPTRMYFAALKGIEIPPERI
jgi:glutathione S-transferase